MKLQGISVNIVRNEYEYNKYVDEKNIANNMTMKQASLTCLGLS